MTSKRIDLDELRAGQQLRFAGVVEDDTDLTACAAITCSFRRWEDDSDADAIASVDVTVLSATEWEVVVDSDETAGWQPGSLRYDVQVEPNTAETSTPQWGRIEVARRITRAKSTNETVSAPLLTSEADFAAPTGAGGEGFAEPPLLIAAAILSAPTGTPGEVAASPDLLDAAATFPAASVASEITASPPLLTSAATFGAPVGLLAPPLDAFTNAPRAAYDMHQRVLTTYTGALHTVRKTTGGDTTTTHDVPYAAATNVVDTADRAAFVGSESWAVTRVLDQAAGARHLTQATGSAQPAGGTTGTGVTINGRAAIDTTPGSSQRLQRSDALGLSGAVALTIFCEMKADAIGAFLAAVAIGDRGTTNGCLEISFTTPTALFIGISGANRGFTVPDMTSATRKVLVALGAGAGIGTVRVWIDGVEQSEVSSVNPANTMSLLNNFTVMGGRASYASGWDGQISRAYFWNADFGAAGNAADLTRALAL